MYVSMINSQLVENYLYILYIILLRNYFDFITDDHNKYTRKHYILIKKHLTYTHNDDY